MVKIVAEAFFTDGAFEIAIGRGDDAHIDADRLAPADPVEFALLEHAQQLGLQLAATYRRFRRGTPCRRRPARTVPACAARAPVNAPFSWPNSSLSSSSRGMRGAVDRDEGLLCARAELWMAPGDELLARAAFAQDDRRGATATAWCAISTAYAAPTSPTIGRLRAPQTRPRADPAPISARFPAPCERDPK